MAGKHKVFLGFAPGVGKTFAMLDEAHRRKKRGQNVVIGFVDTKGRISITEEIRDIEVVPPRQVKSGGHTYLEMDADAIVKLKPDLVLVDDLAHANAPGSTHPKRWQDIEQLLQAGINVISTVNVQHLESLNDKIFEMTAVRVDDTLPDQVLHDAEVEYIDLTPRALINRLQRGDIFADGVLEPNVKPFFEEGTLTALREIAMREAAGVVDEELEEYRKEKRIEKPWAAQDRIMICISPTRSSLRLIRRGWRMGQRMHGEVVAVHVEDGSVTSTKGKKILQDDFSLAERLGIKTYMLKGDLADEIIKFAKEKSITQIILGHPERSRLQEMLKPSILSDLARELRTVDIIVVATETAAEAPH